MSDNLYFARFTVIEAMQTAPSNPLIAEKDKEDQNRRVCQWLDEKGFQVTMDRDYVIVNLEGKWNTVPYGVYITMSSDPKQLFFMDAEEFDKRYEKAG